MKSREKEKEQRERELEKKARAQADQCKYLINMPFQGVILQSFVLLCHMIGTNKVTFVTFLSVVALEEQKSNLSRELSALKHTYSKVRHRYLERLLLHRQFFITTLNNIQLFIALFLTYYSYSAL